MTETKWGTDADIWPGLPPPYIPSQRDIELIHQACPPGLLDEDSSPRILVLGVTPALIGAQWPSRARLQAVDYDQVMVDHLWKQRAGASCHVGRWQQMPFPAEHFDLVIGDCSFNALPGLDHYDDVLREVLRVRRPSAPVILRFFVQPEPRLRLARLVREFEDMTGSNAAAKRLRILIAASEASGRLYFKDVPDRIRSEWGPVDDYLEALGMTEAEIAHANKTYGFDQSLNFPTKAQIVQKFEKRFSKIDFAYPEYDCGQFCPMVSCA